MYIPQTLKLENQKDGPRRNSLGLQFVRFSLGSRDGKYWNLQSSHLPSREAEQHGESQVGTTEISHKNQVLLNCLSCQG